MAKGLLANETPATCTSVAAFTVPENVPFTALAIEPLLIDNVPSVKVVDVILVIPVNEPVKELLPPAIVLFVNVSVVSFNTIVPVAFGNDIVLSAVGFTVVKFVSWSSAAEPSNFNEFCTSIVEEFTVVVVPKTDKFPVIVVLPPTVNAPETSNASLICIDVESEVDNEVPTICKAVALIALVPFPVSIEFEASVATPVPPEATPIVSPDWYSAIPVGVPLVKTSLIGVLSAIYIS